jgi:hypothetical protein
MTVAKIQRKLEIRKESGRKKKILFSKVIPP